KMTKKGREFNEIYDLTAMRVLVGSVKDCYGAIGVIHSLWKPLPGRFKDFVAMPKFNLYQSLHTTVIGPEGRPLEIQIRTREMHDMAEYGVAAHWIYKEDGDDEQGPRARGEEKLRWLRRLLEWQQELEDSGEFVERMKVDLFEDEVFVFTPKGEVKSLAAGAMPPQKVVASPLLADVVREMGFRKADDFYIALGAAKISPKTVVQKVLQRLKQGESAEGEPTAADIVSPQRHRRRRPEASSSSYGIRAEGIDDVMLRLAKCCRPVPGGPIVRYISLCRG